MARIKLTTTDGRTVEIEDANKSARKLTALAVEALDDIAAEPKPPAGFAAPPSPAVALFNPFANPARRVPPKGFRATFSVLDEAFTFPNPAPRVPPKLRPGFQP